MTDTQTVMVPREPTEAESIAKSLTKSQREAVLFWSEVGVKRPPPKPLLQVSEQQWVCTRWGGADERWFLTPLGEQVRAILSHDNAQEADREG